MPLTYRRLTIKMKSSRSIWLHQDIRFLSKNRQVRTNDDKSGTGQSAIGQFNETTIKARTCRRFVK